MYLDHKQHSDMNIAEQLSIVYITKIILVVFILFESSKSSAIFRSS
jgi:hypothetical protein